MVASTLSFIVMYFRYNRCLFSKGITCVCVLHIIFFFINKTNKGCNANDYAKIMYKVHIVQVHSEFSTRVGTIVDQKKVLE